MRLTKSRTRRSIVLVLAVLIVGCARGESTAPRASEPPATTGASFPVTITDDDGVAVTLNAPPERIVTFAPSATEVVFALGLGDRLAGVAGAFDDYPAATKGIDEIGGAGDFGVDPNLEKVVSLRPDLFLTISGGDQWKERLRDLRVPVFTTDSTDLADVFHDIETIGRLTGTVDAAAAIVRNMQAAAADVEARVAGDPAVRCFYEVYYPPLTSVGPDTFIGDLLGLAGCRSVSARAKSDYPQWSVEDLVRQDPEVYLVSSESGATPKAVASRPGFEAVAAIAAGRVIPVEADLVSRPGPRVVDGLRLLARALHPEAFG